MKGKLSTLLTVLSASLLLAGCAGAAQEEAPVAPTASPTPPPTVSAIESAPEPTVPPSPPQPPSVYLEPAVVNLTVGGTATVNVWIDGAYRLNRFVLTMRFNPNYVQVEDADPAREGVQVAPGTIPAPASVVQNEVTVGEGVGKIVYEVAQEAGTEAEGSGVAAVITLRGVAEGGTPLQFESVAVYDGDGNPVEVIALSDGLITVQAAEEGEQASVPEASPQPTTPPVSSPTPQAVPPTPQPTVPPAPTSPVVSGVGTGIYYVVQSGENLFRIGLKFGTTAEAIAEASNITDPSQVQAGTMVLVPVPPPRGRYGYYVQPRDTVYSIARRFGLTVDELVALNGIGPDYRIEVGQILTILP